MILLRTGFNNIIIQNLYTINLVNTGEDEMLGKIDSMRSLVSFSGNFYNVWTEIV